MKIGKIIYKIILVTMLILISNIWMYSVYGEYEIQSAIDAGGSTSNTTRTGSGTGLPNLGDFEPKVEPGEKAKSLISSILGVLLVLGIIVIVISIALIGFNTIMGSASEKAAGKEKYVGLLIAALILTGGSALAKLIISIAETI